jgi:hypothetical protein
MKLLSFITLCGLLSLASCSHHMKSCCTKKSQETCAKENCDKPRYEKETKKCKDGSCEKTKASSDCEGDSCQKKKS